MKFEDEGTALHITLETEIADAVKRFEEATGETVIDIRIDRYGGPEFCIGALVEERAASGS